MTEEFEGTQAVIRNRRSQDRQYYGQKDKQRSTKHYTENTMVTKKSLKIPKW